MGGGPSPRRSGAAAADPATWAHGAGVASWFSFQEKLESWVFVGSRPVFKY